MFAKYSQSKIVSWFFGDGEFPTTEICNSFLEGSSGEITKDLVRNRINQNIIDFDAKMISNLTKNICLNDSCSQPISTIRSRMMTAFIEGQSHSALTAIDNFAIDQPKLVASHYIDGCHDKVSYGFFSIPDDFNVESLINATMAFKGCFDTEGSYWMKLPEFTLYTGEDEEGIMEESGEDYDGYENFLNKYINYSPVTIKITPSKESLRVNQFASADSFVICVYPMDNHCFFNRTIFHPHVDSSGYLCQGYAGETLLKLLRGGLMFEAATVLQEILSIYNESSPYIALPNMFDPSWLTDCNKCHERIHNSSSLFRCPKCGKCFHRTCLRDGNIRVCDSCLGKTNVGQLDENGEFINANK